MKAMVDKLSEVPEVPEVRGEVRKSKRSRVPATQYQAPNPELQQVMKQSLKRKAGEGEKQVASASNDNDPVIFFK